MTFVLSYDDTPKSLNAGGAGSRRHWGPAHKEKRRWEGCWGMLLIHHKVPRGMSRVRIEAALEFADNRRRDVENYRPDLAKALGDALVKGGWLPDDTQEFFDLGMVRIISGVDLLPWPLNRASGHIKSRTTVTIEAEYAAT